MTSSILPVPISPSLFWIKSVCNIPYKLVLWYVLVHVLHMKSFCLRYCKFGCFGNWYAQMHSCPPTFPTRPWAWRSNIANGQLSWWMSSGGRLKSIRREPCWNPLLAVGCWLLAVGRWPRFFTERSRSTNWHACMILKGTPLSSARCWFLTSIKAWIWVEVEKTL